MPPLQLADAALEAHRKKDLTRVQSLQGWRNRAIPYNIRKVAGALGGAASRRAHLGC
jgi:hypothetical protein